MSGRLTQEFVKGQTIVQEGAAGDRTYKILSGEVVVCKQNSLMNLVPIAKLGPGDIFGEMYLFMGSGVRSATVVASSSMVLLEIYYKDEMQDMVGTLTSNCSIILQGFSKRLRNTSVALAEMYQSGSPAGKFFRLPDGTLKQSGTSVRNDD